MIKMKNCPFGVKQQSPSLSLTKFLPCTMIFIFFFSLNKILEVFGASNQKRIVYDDNFIDRLNHYYTNMMLFIFIVVVGTPELVGGYIECWCPKDFEDNEVNYVNYFCWISNTYYIPMSRPIPQSYEIRLSNRIYYYQWTPLIFLVMAFLNKIPRAIWKYMSNRCGVGIKKFMTTAKETQMDLIYNLRRAYQINLFNAGNDPMDHTEYFPPGTDIEEERQKTLKSLAKYIDLWCCDVKFFRAGFFSNTRRRVQELFDFGCSRHHGNYLICLLITVRFLYLVNVTGQLILLNEFLTDDFYIYGYDVITNFLAGKDWSLNHSRFPRVTLCDFDIRQLSNIQRYTLQCVLPINLYNEKIFITLWFWLTFMTVISLLNFCFTVIMSTCTKSRENYVMKYLKLNDIYNENDQEICELTEIFIHTHLKYDGIFVLQMLSNNVGSAITTDIVRYLWLEFYKREYPKYCSETGSYLSSARSLYSNGNSQRSSYHHSNSGLMFRSRNGSMPNNSCSSLASPRCH